MLQFSFHFFFFLQLPVSFYGRSQTARTRWIAPINGEDSEIEVELEDEDVEYDDDTFDPDFLVPDADDPRASTSSK